MDALPPKTPRPFQVSYSQISQFLQCPAQWWFKSVGKYPEKEKKGATMGGVIHRILEAYLKEQEHPANALARDPNSRPHLLVQSAIDQRLLPEPGYDAYLVEHKFKLDTPDGTPLIGTVDILELSPESIRVTDHKSAKTEKYVKTEEELAVDLQTAIYLIAARAMAETAQFVTESIKPTVRHIIYMTEGPLKVFEVGPVELTWPEVEATYLKGVSHVPEMKRLATEKTVANIKGNRSACENFGGCSYKDICPTYSGARAIFSPAISSPKPPTQEQDMELQKLPGESDFAFIKRKMAARQAAPSTTETMGVNPPAQAQERPQVENIPTPPATGTTGRLGTPAPNLQNIPIRTEEGHRIKEAFFGEMLRTPVNVEPAESLVAAIAQAEQGVKTSLESLDPPDSQLPSDLRPLPTERRTEERVRPEMPMLPTSEGELVFGKECKRIGPTMKAALLALGYVEKDVKTMWANAAAVVLHRGLHPAQVVVMPTGEVLWTEDDRAKQVPEEEVRRRMAETYSQPNPARSGGLNTTATERASMNDALLTWEPATFTLLVDCMPARRQYLDMADHLRPSMEAVEKKMDVPLYSLLDMGRGPRLVASYLLTPEGRIQDGDLVVVRGQPDWREPVLGILRRDPRCVEIVGLRG